MSATQGTSVVTTTVAYLGLGSNMGRREAAVLAAVKALQVSGVGTVTALSPLYETDPVDMPHAPHARRFINAVVELNTLLSPGDLLQRVKGVEGEMGRSGGHYEPREIDVDIIAYGDATAESTDLTLPHPRYTRRAFVLIPLRDIAPGFCCPRTGATIDRMVTELAQDDGVVRISNRGVATS